MKKIYVLLIIITMLLTACQPTPEELVVKSKADGKLDELIQQTAEPKASAAAEEPAESSATYTTTSYDYSFKSKDEDVTINVAAEVAMQDGAKYQVVDITHSDFSMEFVENACKVLLEGREMFEPRKGQTKDEIEAEILNLQAAIANPAERKSDGLRSGDPKIIAEVTKMFEDRIKIYKQLMEEAPVTIEKVPVKFEYMPKKYYTKEARYQEDLARYSGETEDEQVMEILDKYDNERQLIVDADLSNDYYGRVEVLNYSSKWLNRGYFRFIKSKELNPNTYEPYMSSGQDENSVEKIEMTPEEAMAFADKLLDDLDIENMTMYKMSLSTTDGTWYDYENDDLVEIPEEKTVYAYRISYIRQYGSLPVMESSIYYKTAEPEYGPRYENESLGISIEKDGITRFKWNNMPQITKVENDNVAILPIDEIMDIFNKQMALQYNTVGLFPYDETNHDYEKLLESITDARVDISSIKLKMVRIPIQNQMGAYRMIPAWIFKGKGFFSRDGGPSYEEVIDRIQEECFLIVNAIDGSIIQ